MAATAKGQPVPHPRDLGPVLGSGPSLRTDLLQTFLDGWRECGDVVWYRGPRPMYVVAHPDDVQHVLQDHYEGHHPRSRLVSERTEAVMGEGLFRSGGELWRRQYRLVQPAFDHRRVPAYATLMTETAAGMLARWRGPAERGQPLEIQAEMMRLCLDVIGPILYGDDWARDGETIRQALTDANEFAIPRVTGFPTPLERLTPAYRRFRRGLDTLATINYRAIDERRRRPTEDLISTFVHARDPQTGEGMADLQAHDEIVTALFGVYKSIPYCLSWTWHLLSKHPRAGDRLRAELAEVLGGRTPTVEDIPRLQYTTMVIREVLRLYPPLYIMSRPPVEDDVIRGYHIPPDVLLLVIPYITHRHPDFWENPEGFEPERFTPERSAGRHPFAYLPFALGKRRCIGEAYSLMQMQLTVALVAQHYRLDLVPGHAIIRLPEFLLRAANGLPMTLAALPRQGDGAAREMAAGTAGARAPSGAG